LVADRMRTPVITAPVSRRVTVMGTGAIATANAAATARDTAAATRHTDTIGDTVATRVMVVTATVATSSMSAMAAAEVVAAVVAILTVETSTTTATTEIRVRPQGRWIVVPLFATSGGRTDNGPLFVSFPVFSWSGSQLRARSCVVSVMSAQSRRSAHRRLGFTRCPVGHRAF
jgi:hypothetical protein